MSRYKVAIRCTSYNHAPYIEKTLEGLSTQKTNFNFVAVVIDDASTDGTQDVIKQYMDNFFVEPGYGSCNSRETEDAITYFRQHKENRNCYLAAVFLKYNFYQIKKSKDPIMAEWMDDADYWAMCECDDYWIYDRKLQEEVEILDNHKEYALVYTDYDINYYATGEYVHAAFKNGLKPVISSFEQHLVSKAYIAPMSWVCRIPRKELLDNYQGPASIDGSFIIALELFLRSKVYYLDKVTCVYGVHEGSATRQTSYSNQYKYAYGVYLTQKYYLDKYNLREKYPNCLDYFLNAFYCYIISHKIIDEFEEVKLFFHRNRESSLKFRLFESMMKSQWMFPLLQLICKLRIKNN